MAASGAFFGTRAKDNLRFTRNRSLPVDDLAVVRSDHIGEPAVPKSRHDFPWPQRKARYFDAETARTLVLPPKLRDWRAKLSAKAKQVRLIYL